MRTNEDFCRIFAQLSWIPEVKITGGQKRFKTPNRPSYSSRRRMQSDRCRRPIRLSNAYYPSKTGWSRPGKIIFSRRLCPYRLGPLA